MKLEKVDGWPILFVASVIAGFGLGVVATSGIEKLRSAYVEDCISGERVLIADDIDDLAVHREDQRLTLRFVGLDGRDRDFRYLLAVCPSDSGISIYYSDRKVNGQKIVYTLSAPVGVYTILGIQPAGMRPETLIERFSTAKEEPWMSK